MDSAESAGRDFQNDRLLEFWDIDPFFLQIWVAANSTGRVKLGGTSPVRVTASDDRAYFSDLTDIGHKSC